MQGKTNFDYKRKKTRPNKTQTTVSCKAIREFYSDLGDVKHDDNNFSKAFKLLKLEKQCSNSLLTYEK